MIVYEKVASSFLRYLVVLFFTMAAMFSDWPLVGVLLICGFYRWKNTKWDVQLPIIYTTFFYVDADINICLFTSINAIFSSFFWIRYANSHPVTRCI